MLHYLQTTPDRVPFSDGYFVDRLDRGALELLPRPAGHRRRVRPHADRRGRCGRSGRAWTTSRSARTPRCRRRRSCGRSCPSAARGGTRPTTPATASPSPASTTRAGRSGPGGFGQGAPGQPPPHAVVDGRHLAPPHGRRAGRPAATTRPSGASTTRTSKMYVDGVPAAAEPRTTRPTTWTWTSDAGRPGRPHAGQAHRSPSTVTKRSAVSSSTSGWWTWTSE